MDIIDGRFVGAGGKNVYVKELGDGSPTIIIETDIGGLSAEWDPIQRELAKSFKTVTYDRAGYGESPKSDDERATVNIAEEFFDWTQNSQLEPPYVIIAHGYGGLIAREFAKTYGAFVGGIVFVDAFGPNEDEIDKLDLPNYREKMSTKTRTENLRNIAEMDDKKFGIIVPKMIEGLYPALGEDIRHQLYEYQTDRKFYETIVDEFDALPISLEVAKRPADFPVFPVKYICRDPKVMEQIMISLGIPNEEAEKVEDVWFKNAKETARISPDSEFQVAEGADHNIHLCRAELILKAACDIAEKVKKEE